MRMEIKSIYGNVLYSGEAATLSELVCNAVRDGARLVGARLVGARLVGARLVGARLVGASLDGARLVGARLVGASLDRASLDGVNWGTGAKIGAQTILWADPLVTCDGYAKVLCAVGDVAWIMAGCRWFTLADAREMLDGIAAVAKLRGLKEE